MRSLELVDFEVPPQLLKQSLPIGELLIVKDNHHKSPATFPYQIPGKYFGLIEYHIEVKLNDLDRLRFIPDSEAFQNYSIELNYDYYDMTRTNYNSSIFVQGSFQEFISDWHEMWNVNLVNKGRSTLPYPNDERHPSRWKKFNNE